MGSDEVSRGQWSMAEGNVRIEGWRACQKRGRTLLWEEEIQDAGGVALEYNAQHNDQFITPPPCAWCLGSGGHRQVENGPDGWGDNYE